jgi:hypothetical protein
MGGVHLGWSSPRRLFEIGWNSVRFVKQSDSTIPNGGQRIADSIFDFLLPLFELSRNLNWCDSLPRMDS